MSEELKKTAFSKSVETNVGACPGCGGVIKYANTAKIESSEITAKLTTAMNIERPVNRENCISLCSNCGIMITIKNGKLMIATPELIQRYKDTYGESFEVFIKLSQQIKNKEISKYNIEECIAIQDDSKSPDKISSQSRRL